MSDIAKLKTQQHRLPSINRSKYGRRAGLEGPFMTKAGQVVYYDHKKGQYLDPDKDMYLSYDDWKKLSEDTITEKLKAGRGKVSINVKSEPPADFRGSDKEYSNAMKKLYKITIKSNPRTGMSQVSGEKSDILKYLQSYDYGIHDPDIEGVWPQLLEDAPVNATGTAVAGTGDDSSTVIVKKKKKPPMQDKLMRRLKIQETIDKTIPDLEYEEDEITKRTNQLKEMASNKYVGYGDAIKASIKTTEERDSWLKDIALNADKKLPYDKETDQPKKYVAGLSDKKKKAHDRHLEKQGKKSDSDKSAYKQSPADKVAKTKPSVHTKKYKQMFGESDVELNEVIKGLKKKAEKSGMPYSILKQVYNRGMAAWKGGHRPGTTPQQWAFARVNSFITKSSGTWGKADSDLAKKVRGS
jgi:hypothetical protein